MLTPNSPIVSLDFSVCDYRLVTESYEETNEWQTSDDAVTEQEKRKKRLLGISVLFSFVLPSVSLFVLL